MFLKIDIKIYKVLYLTINIMSLSVEFNNYEINKIVIENTLKMLERRKIIPSWEDEFKNIDINDIRNKNEFALPKYQISIYLLNARLTTIVQGHPLDTYLSNNININIFTPRINGNRIKLLFKNLLKLFKSNLKLKLMS